MLIQYTGSVSYEEYPDTSVRSLWQPNQAQDVSGSRLSALLATGNFQRVAEVVQVQNQYKSMAEFNAAGGAASYGDGPVWIGGKFYLSDGGELGAAIESAERGSYLIPFGDSLTATFWRQINLTGSITVTDGVATATTANNHASPIGSKVRVGLSATSALNGVFTITATPAANQFSFTVPTSTPASTTVVSEVSYFESDQNFSANYLHYLKAFSKQRFYTPYNGGLGGDDTGEALSRFDAENIIAMNPGRILIMLGTNDALSATSQDITTASENLQALYQKCLAAGIAVDACTIPPFGSGYADVSSTTKVGFLLALNKWIRDFVRVTPGMRLHDVYQWVTDPAQANGQALSGYLGADGIHFDKNGAYYVGKKMAENYANWLGSHQDKLPSSQADGWTFNTSSKNRFQNHTMQGAGPVATGWSTTYTGSGNTKTDTTVARTVIKDGDEFGQNQKSALNSTASGSTGTHLVYQDPTARMTAGKTYVARGSVTIKKGAVTVLASEISIGFTVGGIAKTIRAGIADIFDATGTFHFETPAFVYPSGSSSPLFYLRSTTTGSASDAEIEWGRVELEQID